MFAKPPTSYGTSSTGSKLIYLFSANEIFRRESLHPNLPRQPPMKADSFDDVADSSGAHQIRPGGEQSKLVDKHRTTYKDLV